MATKVELKKEDLEVIERMAEKYDITVQDLARSLLSRKYPRLQILLTPEELQYIDDCADGLNLSRSMYCYLCFKKAVDDKLYENMNIIEIVKKGNHGRRTQKVAVSFTELSDYNKMVKFAEDLGINFSSIIRYFSMNVNLREGAT